MPFVCIVLMLLVNSAVSLRRKRRVTEVRAAKDKVAYTIALHKRVSKGAAEAWLEEHEKIAKYLGDGFPDTLARGTSWPDCPIMLQDRLGRLCVEPEDVSDSCVSVPGAGEIGIHEGLTEMGVQLVKQNLPLLGSMRIKERMGNNRMLAQHHHASPLPTIHLVMVDQNCGQTCIDTLKAYCDHSSIDPKAYYCHLPPFSTRFLGSDFILPQIQPVTHALSTNQQLRNKILEHSGKWYCKAMQHITTALLLQRDFETYPEENLSAPAWWDETYETFQGWLEQAVRLLRPAGNHSLHKSYWDTWSKDDVKKWWESERELGTHYLGRILHPLQDSFSRSHAERQWGYSEELPEITQFLTMDDVDWRKHSALDKVDDSMLESAKKATSMLLAEFGRWFASMKIKLDTVSHTSPRTIDDLGGYKLFDNGLRRALHTLCKAYKIRPDLLTEPAGGSQKHVSLSGASWTPMEMPENLAEEYRQMKGVYDYPPNDNICTSKEVNEDPNKYPGTYRRKSKTARNRFVLGGDGLGVSLLGEISLTCAGLGVEGTLTLQEVGYKNDPKLLEEGIEYEVFYATNVAWWRLYTDAN